MKENCMNVINMDMNNKNLWYLSIEAEIKDGDFKEDLLSKVKAIGD